MTWHVGRSIYSAGDQLAASSLNSQLEADREFKLFKLLCLSVTPPFTSKIDHAH